MTRGDGMTEGLGRFLATRTKQEAADVTVAIPPPEHIPAAKDKEFDPTISDVWRAEDLGVQESENLPRKAANDTASRILPVVETQVLAVCCGGSKQNQSAPEAALALEARPVSTVREKSMRWQTLVIALLCVVTGGLVYKDDCANKRSDALATKVDGLTTWYVDSQFGSPAALEGKTCLEITPQMQELVGIERFVSIAERLPYADGETVDGLIKRNIRKISGVWRSLNSNARTIVQLESFDGKRSVLVHVNPASVSVYVYEFAQRSQGYEPRIEDSSFRWRNRYSIDDGISQRMVAYAANTPTVTHAELKELKDMFVIGAYDNERALFLVAPYGTGERFVRLEDADYHALSSGANRSDGYSNTLEYSNYSWWLHNIKHPAIKEEQTAVK